MTSGEPVRTGNVPLRRRAEQLLPLAVGYLLLCCLYVWQASNRPTPTIFIDELQLAQISRAIAETGLPGLRGEPFGFTTLYAYLQAPAWWLDDTGAAYAAAKTIGVLTMTAAVFPAYGLARMVVSRPWALFAALTAGAVPALSYSSFLMEEPLAYPAATLVLWLIARALAEPRRGTLVAAAAGCLVMPLVREQLAVLVPTFLLGLAVLGWQSARFRAWRAGWSRADWLGVAVLGIGGVLALSAFLGHQSESWYQATGFFKGRMLEYGLWAVGALAIGLGVLPLVAGLSGLAARARDPDPRVRAFVTTSVAALLTFGFYTAVKAAYISTVFATRVEERNLIYLSPLLLIATAAALERPRLRALPLAGAGLLALYLVRTTPLELDSFPYGDAPGLAIGALANRELVWDTDRIRTVLTLVVLASIGLLVAQRLARGRWALAVGAVAAALVLTWTLTAEVYAAYGSNRFAQRLHANLPKPLDWVDRAVDGDSAMYFGQSIDDANGIHLLEFWNRSVEKVWSFDGTAPGPGPSLSPDLAAPDGTLTPSPEVGWAVAENDVRLAGERVGEPYGSLQLVRLDGPLRLESAVSGILGDGWMSSAASFTQYQAPPGGSERGFVKIFLSRSGWCGTDVPGNVTVRVGSVVVADKQPALGEVTATRRGVLHACQGLPFLVPVTVPFRVEVTIEPTFSPAALDERSSDLRELGAQPSFEFVPIG